MRLSLRPHQNKFYPMFAASGENLVVGARLLKELLGADMQTRKVIAEKMRGAEHAGDEATHAIMRQLNESFVTPFDREDIYNLASNLDDVMDHMDAAVDLVALYAALGFAAQLVDGALPALASASVHAAEVATTGLAGGSHLWHRNVDRRLFRRLARAGVAGGALGACMLVELPGAAVGGAGGQKTPIFKESWSGRRDPSPRPRPWQGCAP